MGYWIAIASVVGNVAAQAQQSKAAKENAASQQEAAELSAAAGAAFTEDQYARLGEYSERARESIGDFENSFVRTPNATEFFDDAAELDAKGFAFQTGLKRGNLDFITGDTQDDLRETQGDFAALAAGDFSEFKSELNASLLRANAEAFGSPVGTAFNIAAKDRFNFRTAGLNETLRINDFFAREGTVDPPDPVRTAFDLSIFEQAENKRKDTRDIAALDATLSSERDIFGAGFDIGKVGLLAETNSLQAIGQLGGVGSAANGAVTSAAAQGLGSLYGILQNRQQQQRQDELTERQTQAFEQIAAGQRSTID